MTRVWNRLLLWAHDERGQATVEYFLVILAATALAIIALKWLQSSGGTGILGKLFSKVIKWVTGNF